MKLIISLLFFLLISCEQISKEEVINTIEDTKETIVKKTIKSPDTSNKVKIKVEEDKANKNKIFYLIGEPYYIEGVKYVPEENELDLYLHVNNFKNYQDLKNIVNEINFSDKYTSENIGNFYKLIIGPIDNKTADKLLSTFISKGYKESKLILN